MVPGWNLHTGYDCLPKMFKSLGISIGYCMDVSATPQATNLSVTYSNPCCFLQWVSAAILARSLVFFHCEIAWLLLAVWTTHLAWSTYHFAYSTYNYILTISYLGTVGIYSVIFGNGICWWISFEGHKFQKGTTLDWGIPSAACYRCCFSTMPQKSYPEQSSQGTEWLLTHRFAFNLVSIEDYRSGMSVHSY